MSVKLSKTRIESFCGDVLPLHINFDMSYHSNLKSADIVWSSSNDCVAIRSFSGEDEMSFNNGVLIILNKVGESTVSATLNGKEYTCEVCVREMKHATAEDELNYYVGDLHDHTSEEHNHDRFAHRTKEFQSEYIDYLKSESNIDFGVISDHAGTINDTDFFRGFCEVENAGEMHTVVFPGCEAEAIIRENDRFGILHQNGGEIVTFNAAGYGAPKCWDDFDAIYKSSPLPVCIFAHPQGIGFSTPGVWNFNFCKNNRPDMLRIMRGVEMGDGSERQQNLIHEYAFFSALDAGFRVSTTCSSDSHGSPHKYYPNEERPDARWGYYRFPGKTVIMAQQKSKEAFIDALRDNRFYATESGNVKIRYTVNGKTAPCDLPLADTYKFHVELSYFKDNPDNVPVNCRVMSDGGEALLTLTDVDFSSFDFEIKSSTARYFFLRFIDSKGYRTWSVPVWTGREFDKYEEPDVTPIDMSECEAVELTENGAKDASVLIDGNPLNNYDAESDKPSFVIDMKKERRIRALGSVPRTFDRKTYTVNLTRYSMLFTSGIATELRVSVSLDGKSFCEVARKRCNTFGAEMIITFPETEARYVRVDVLSTVGNDTVPKNYGGTKVGMAELSVFE